MPTTVAVIGCVGLLCGSLLFKTTLKMWGVLLIISIHALKWTLIIGFLMAFLNMPQMYRFLGWTPVSILFGPDIYDRALNKYKHAQYKHAQYVEPKEYPIRNRNKWVTSI